MRVTITLTAAAAEVFGEVCDHPLYRGIPAANVACRVFMTGLDEWMYPFIGEPQQFPPKIPGKAAETAKVAKKKGKSK